MLPFPVIVYADPNGGTGMGIGLLMLYHEV